MCAACVTLPPDGKQSRSLNEILNKATFCEMVETPSLIVAPPPICIVSRENAFAYLLAGEKAPIFLFEIQLKHSTFFNCMRQSLVFFLLSRIALKVTLENLVTKANILNQRNI